MCPDQFPNIIPDGIRIDLYGETGKRRRSIDESSQWERSNKLRRLNESCKGRNSRATIHGSQIQFNGSSLPANCFACNNKRQSQAFKDLYSVLRRIKS